MKTIIVRETTSEEIDLCMVNHERDPIFAIKNGKVAGMVVEEEDGYILRIGGKYGSHGHCGTLQKLIKEGEEFGFKFAVDIKV